MYANNINERGAGGNKPVVSPNFFDSIMNDIILFISLYIIVLLLQLGIYKFDKSKHPNAITNLNHKRNKKIHYAHNKKYK